MKIISEEEAMNSLGKEEGHRIYAFSKESIPNLDSPVYCLISDEEFQELRWPGMVDWLTKELFPHIYGTHATPFRYEERTSSMWISTAKDYFKELSLRLEDRRFMCHYFSPADIPGASEITYVMWNSNESYSLEEQKDFVKEYWELTRMAEANTVSSVLGEKDILEERQKTHGDFTNVAETSQELKEYFRNKADWYNLTNVQREALDNIAQKTARIFAGNPNFADHWVDIQGYAKLAEKEIRKGENQDGPTSPK